MNTVTQPHLEDFHASINRKISDWVSRPNRSRRMLARLSGMRYGTLGNLLAKQAPSKRIAPEKILKLLAVLDNIEITEAYEKYKSELQMLHKVSFSRPAETCDFDIDLELSANKKFTRDFVEAMKNPVALAIYTLSVNTSGVSENTILQRFGSYSEDIIKDLVEKKIIVKNHRGMDYFFAINKEMLNFEREQIQKIIPKLNSFYKKEHSGQQRNYIHFRVGSVNKEALARIYEAYAELDDRVTKIVSSLESSGPIPFYGFAQLDTFVDDIE